MNANFSAPDAQNIIRTVGFLCEYGYFGYAGLDERFCGIWRHGELTSWVPLGASVCQNADLFFGLEKELLDLQDAHGACLTLPRVGIPTDDDKTAKMSVEIYWDDVNSVYHVLAHKLVSESEVELELLKQIRARRLAEENFQSTRNSLERKEMLLDIMMDHLPIAAAIFDDKRQYLFATRRWSQNFGVECEPIIGQDCFEAGGAFPEEEKQILAASLAGLTPNAEARRPHMGAANDIHHRWTHQCWKNADGSRGGVLTAVEDLRDVVNSNIELQHENSSLRAINRELARLASILTHDLNAPFRSLQDFIEAPLRSGMEPVTAEFRQRIQDHIERMRAILDGIHDYCQVLCYEPSVTSVDVRSLVNAILNTLPKKDAFAVTFDLDTETVETNGSLLDLVLRNILDNAIKHHDRDSGSLHISLKDEGEFWKISIEDDGPGIALTQMEKLSGSMSSRSAIERDSPGMGLSIIRRVLEGIRGRVSVFSDTERSRGTQFNVYWPKSFTSSRLPPNGV